MPCGNSCSPYRAVEGFLFLYFRKQNWNMPYYVSDAWNLWRGPEFSSCLQNWRGDTINKLNVHKATSTFLALFFKNVHGVEDK